MPAIKRDKRDILFSRIIRARAGWRCEACGTSYKDRPQGLHCSHLFSRRHKSTRWDEDNAFAHCFGCHQRLGGDPVEFVAWAVSRLGQDKVDALRLKAHSVTKFTKAELELIHADLKQRLAEIED